MITTNCEKDNPLGQTVLPPESFPFCENPRFFPHPLSLLITDCGDMSLQHIQKYSKDIEVGLILIKSVYYGNTLYIFSQDRDIAYITIFRDANFDNVSFRHKCVL